MFAYATTIKMRDVDAAGVLFYGRYFGLAHDAYEAFMESCGYSSARIMNDEPFIIPVVHAEADYHIPLRLGDAATIQVHADEVKRRAYRIICEMRTPEGKIACMVRTTHMTVDKAKKKSIPLPESLREALQKHVSV